LVKYEVTLQRDIILPELRDKDGKRIIRTRHKLISLLKVEENGTHAQEAKDRAVRRLGKTWRVVDWKTR
jgi:hypothetical protein